MKFNLLGSFVIAGALLAQPNKSVELKRNPPPAAGVPSPEQYPFGKLIQTLEGQAPLPAALPVSPSASPDLPKDFNPA